MELDTRAAVRRSAAPLFAVKHIVELALDRADRGHLPLRGCWSGGRWSHRRPLRTGAENRYRPTTSQRNPSFVRIVLTSIAPSTTSTAIATRRPGCRTGTALIGAGDRARNWRSSAHGGRVVGGCHHRQLVGLISEVGIAPLLTPYLSRIDRSTESSSGGKLASRPSLPHVPIYSRAL